MGSGQNHFSFTSHFFEKAGSYLRADLRRETRSIDGWSKESEKTGKTLVKARFILYNKRAR